MGKHFYGLMLFYTPNEDLSQIRFREKITLFPPPEQLFVLEDVDFVGTADTGGDGDGAGYSLSRALSRYEVYADLGDVHLDYSGGGADDEDVLADFQRSRATPRLEK